MGPHVGMHFDFHTYVPADLLREIRPYALNFVQHPQRRALTFGQHAGTFLKGNYEVIHLACTHIHTHMRWVRIYTHIRCDMSLRAKHSLRCLSVYTGEIFI